MIFEKFKEVPNEQKRFWKKNQHLKTSGKQ